MVLPRWNRLCYGNLHAMKRNIQLCLDVITPQIWDCGFLDDLGRAES